MSTKSPESSVFHVTILDAGDRPLQEGSLEATPTSLVYTEETSLTRYSWPLKQLRKCEMKGERLFVIEGGKLSLSGIGMYRFSTPHAKQIYTVVSRHMTALSQQQPSRHTTATRIPSNSYSETSPIHWKLNTSLSSDSGSNHSPVHSRSSSKDGLGNFDVELLLPDIRGTERGILDITSNSVVYTEALGGKMTQWPIEYLRRYGCEADIFTVETGRRCVGGPRLYNFRTNRAAEINAAIKLLSSTDRRSSSSMSPSPTDVKMPTPPPALPPMSVSATPPPRRGPLPPLPSSLPPTPPSQPHPPLPPSQPPLRLPPSQPPLPLPPPSQPPTLPSSSPLKQSHTHNHTHAPSSHLQSNTTSAPFKRSDSLIRRAFSAMDIRKDVFEVRNISDDRNEVGQGTVEVTATDLIYIDAMTNEKWKWPFKFLRKYGFEENIFTFEAGRRCPGGQGLYAFASERANEIHEAIVENIRGRKNLVPAAPSRSPRSNPRLSLTGESMTSSPPIQLSNRNQYDITSSPGSTRKWASAQNSPQRSGFIPQKLERLENSASPQLVTPPTVTPTSKESPPISPDASAKATPTATPAETDVPTSSKAPPTATPTARPRSQRPASTTAIESMSSSLTSTCSDPTHSDSARFSGSVKSSTPSTSTEEDGSTSPVPHNLVKPALEPVRAIQREHLYDVPQCIQMKEREKALSGSQATDVATIPGEGELLSSNSGEHTNSGQPKKSSKFGRKGSNAQDSHAEVALVIAQDGGCGSISVKGGKKDKQNVLSWLRKKSRSGSTNAEERAEAPRSKSKKKKGRKRSGKGTSEHEDRGQLSDETDGLGVYENLKVVKLKKTAYSASCDNILESLSKEESSSSSTAVSAIPQPSLKKLMTNSHSIDMPSISSVPQPRLRGSVSPSSLSDDTPFSATPTTTTMYQNLQEANEDREKAVQATPTATPSHLYSNVELSSLPEKEIAHTDTSSPLYSNVAISNIPEDEPSPPKQMSYAVVDILSPPPQKSKRQPPKFRVTKQASLTSIMVAPKQPAQSGSCTNRQRSHSTFDSHDSAPNNDVGDESVVYAKLDLTATSAVAQMRAERRDVRNFEDLLERHDVREMEMDGQRRRKLNIT